MKEPSKTSVYEFPLNNRLRTFLRYEYLINALDEALEKRNDELKAIMALHQLLELIKCSDIKSELIQHTKWQKQQLQSYEASRQVDQKQLEHVLNAHQKSIEAIDEFEMPIHFYQNHHFLNLMKLRLNVPAGACGFNVPQLQAWLGLPESEKYETLASWKRPFDTIGNALEACMQLIRKSRELESILAEEGFYSHNLDPCQNHSLLRVLISSQTPIYPEVSSGKNRFTIYFFSINSLEKKPAQVKHDVPFTMALCSL